MRCVRCRAGVTGVRTCPECRDELAEAGHDLSEIERLYDDAVASLASGEPQRSLRLLQKLGRQDKLHAGAREALVVTHGLLGRHDRALAALESFHGGWARLEPDAATPLRSRPRGTSRAALTSTGRRNVASTAVRAADLALFYRQKGLLALSEGVLRDAMASGDDLAEHHLILASVLRAQGQMKQALLELKKARTRGEGGEHAAVAYELGLCHEAMGELKKAAQQVASAVALEPDNPHMHLTLGMLYEKQGRPRLARKAYRVAASLDSAFAPAFVDVSFRLALAALEEGNLERSLQEFTTGLSESASLFSPAVVGEVEHLVSHLVAGEQVRAYAEASEPMRRLSRKALADVEDAFGLAARLGAFVGLSCFWDASDDGEPGDAVKPFAPMGVEPDATWLEGVGPGGCLLRGVSVGPQAYRRPAKRGRRRVVDERAEATAMLARPAASLGFPAVSFEYVFEEWLGMQARMASRRIVDRPLAEPEVYQRLVSVLGAALQRVRGALEREGLLSDDAEADSEESVEAGVALWAAIVGGYLLRGALERCRRYPPEFVLHLVVAERYRQRRLFGRALQELEAAVAVVPESASVHNLIWNLCIREGRYAEAIEHCHAVLRFTPHAIYQAAAYNDLAYCMVERGENPKLALLYTEKARELAPQLFDAHVADTVGWLHFKQGDLEEALRLIEQVIEAGCSDESALLATSLHFYHYGHVLQALGREEDASEAFAVARELETDADSDWGITRRLRRERRKAR
ncbi:MAG: hypothetical protein EB084_07070 [Proteobacteria bacterium]|nr:hypothetical protein [Pseudomonadota bacterium]